ncbi:DUF3084 domain-containing protein [Scytonema sp. NUACC26]|uniref:DUF3084 domain-containing protein n=1 Tax=Scytonema sp. NUACC26 TaxID=3140176 RepID=UPI0034DC59E5
MTTGYILILAILILGGAIATVGDRIGTRVGKARLSLFNLRPKNTAVLVTILTGTLVSASTLAILFAADEGLRKGVFELEDIQKDLRRKRESLESTTQQLDITRKELEQARKEQQEKEERLQKTNESLKEANTKQQATQNQLNSTTEQLSRTLSQQAQIQAQLQNTETQLDRVVTRYKQTVAELKNVDVEKKKLLAEVEKLKIGRQKLFAEAKRAIAQAQEAIDKRDRELANRQEVIEQRDKKINDLDRLIQERNQAIAEREKVIAQRESRLKDLETQQNELEQEVARLEKFYQSYRELRLGKLALVRGQVLASGVVRIEQPPAARQAIVQLLQEANRTANLRLTEPGTNTENSQILFVTKEQIDNLSQQIKDGREYVVRVFSAGNYVRGENNIQFFADATLNQKVFTGGEVLAATTADPQKMTAYQLRQRLELLISASQFRARNAGILDSIQIDSTLYRFISQLRQYNLPLDIKAVAAEDTFTAGPLKVKLIAIQNGQVVFST